MTIREFISLALSKQLWHIYATLAGLPPDGGSGGGGGGGTTGGKIVTFLPIVPDSTSQVPANVSAYSFVLTEGVATVAMGAAEQVPLPLNVPVTGMGPLADIIRIEAGNGAAGLLTYETFA